MNYFHRLRWRRQMTKYIAQVHTVEDPGVNQAIGESEPWLPPELTPSCSGLVAFDRSPKEVGHEEGQTGEIEIVNKINVPALQIPHDAPEGVIRRFRMAGRQVRNLFQVYTMNFIEAGSKPRQLLQGLVYQETEARVGISLPQLLDQRPGLHQVPQSSQLHDQHPSRCQIVLRMVSTMAFRRCT